MKYILEKLTLFNFIRLYIHKISGTENIPKKTPFIAASNHASYADDLMIPYVIVNETNKEFNTFVNSRFWENFFLKKFLNHYDVIPVDVTKSKSKKKKTSKKAFIRALESIKNGKNFMIFPEGSRTCDNKLQRGKTGVARLALLAKVPVVPFGIVGSYDILPKGAFFPRFKRAEIKIGKPMYFNKNYNKKITKTLLRKITDEIMKEIAKLIGQEYN